MPARAYHGKVCADRLLPLAMLFGIGLAAQSYTAPAGIRPPVRKSGASILPGGRIIAPFGEEYPTAPGPFGLVVSPSGKLLASADTGPWIYGITILEADKNARLEERQVVTGSPYYPAATDWKSVSGGIAFAAERGLYVAEGNSGRISYFDSADERRRTFELNQNGYHDSFAGDLAFDAARGILYAADQANFRVAVIDVKSRQVIGSVKTGRLPFVLALSPDRRTLYAANTGIFEYRAIPGADPSVPAAPALAFPPFGFPTAESAAGVTRAAGHETVQVPGLGDPNDRESNSLAIVDVSDPAHAKVQAFVRTGAPLGNESAGGSGPAGVLAAAGRVFVANANQDSITVIDARTNAVEAEIPIHIPGLESLRGVLPLGMAYHEATGWLLVAEAGINAVGVIDVDARRVLGHIPTAWFPTRVALHGDTVFVANAKGHGVGPNVSAWTTGGPPAYNQLYQGSLSTFPLPAAAALPAQTAVVLAVNGFLPARKPPLPIPAAIRYVVLVVKESRTFDELLGDIGRTASGPAMGVAALARLGSQGYVDGHHERISIRDADLTPNHHAIARRWSFSDNFYADSEGAVDGHHWLAGAYPNAWLETSILSAFGDRKDFRLGAAPGRLEFAGPAASVQPEDVAQGGAIWSHLAKHGVSFDNFGEGFEFAGVAQGRGLEPTGARLFTNMPMPDALYRNTSREYPGFNIYLSDQYRVSQFIHEMQARAGWPRFLYVHLPNDYLAAPRPADGYPYEESFMADNDYALGRLLEYLSGTPQWRDMVVFVTEADAAGGLDHIDAHRTLLLCAGPWARRGYVSHVNASFPALLKTIFRVLGVPPLNLFDAAAADLADCLSARPDPAAYRTAPPDKRIFDPDK